MKVVWICHFSDEKVRAKLPLASGKKYVDFAPWITNLIKGFEKVEGIELHIIAPHSGLLRNTYEYTDNNIQYHFFRRGLPIVNREWPRFFPVHQWTNFLQYRLAVKKFIRKINPDIVNLHGAENDYYSVTALDIKKIPVYVTIQGIYSNPARFENTNLKPNKSRINIERKIHTQKKYFGIFPPFMAELIRRDNPEATLLIRNYPPDLHISPINNPEKKYDFVFFGRVSDVKGMDKIIEALALIKKKGREKSLLVIGQFGKDYKEYLDQISDNHKISHLITYTGYLQTLAEVHQKAAEARVTVVSSKFDNIPGSVVEGALLGLPVIATAVGSLPYLNKGEQRILLSEYGDIEALAKNMLFLLDNPEMANSLTQKLQNFILTEFSENYIIQMFINQYRAIIEHELTGKPIDSSLLWVEELFTPNKN